MRTSEQPLPNGRGSDGLATRKNVLTARRRVGRDVLEQACVQRLANAPRDRARVKCPLDEGLRNRRRFAGGPKGVFAAALARHQSQGDAGRRTVMLRRMLSINGATITVFGVS